jgi:flavin reductase (DIM6/NTAB) family NADH-FMN oxidoreductase RutF
MNTPERGLVERFHDAMSHVAVDVEILTMVGPDGAPLGMTISSLTQVSTDPPSVLVCVGPQGSVREALRPGTAFSIGVLGSGQVPEALAFAYGTEDPFTLYEWTPAADGTPTLADTAVTIACEVENIVDHHGTAVVLAKVTDAAVHNDEVLVYWRKRYHGELVNTEPDVKGTW